MSLYVNSEDGGFRDPAEFIEASYTDNPIDHLEPELVAIANEANDALVLALRYCARLESRSYEVVAAEAGLHPETVRRAVKRLSERIGVRAPIQRSPETAERCRKAQLGHPRYYRGYKKDRDERAGKQRKAGIQLRTPAPAVHDSNLQAKLTQEVEAVK